ncbi:hypothetical protein Tsumi_00680 [Porphyromonas miyakawae]|uniref:Uncharacterized protein n=1 Tax=Porphyromonas miyakawae TaxID=3137470 RepID=A0ABQ0DZY1_9PORP
MYNVLCIVRRSDRKAGTERATHVAKEEEIPGELFIKLCVPFFRAEIVISQLMSSTTRQR